MVKKDDKNEKNSPAPRGRIMQVVEVEEENASSQKADVPIPSEIVKNEMESQDVKAYPKEEEPDISSSFAAPVESIKEEVRGMSSYESQHESLQESEKEIQPLKSEDKRDIVSELFDTKKDTVQYPDISIDKKSSPFGFILWVIVLLVIVGGIGGGLVYFKQKSASTETVQSAILTPPPTLIPTETETPMATPSGKTKTPTPTKSASPSSTTKKIGLSIQVLNGSGKSGVASSMKKFLEEKGYTVVGTGNAKNFDYEQTEIVIKADKTSSLEKLKTDLSGSYTVGSTSATLDSTVTYDAQVIIGKE